MPPIRWPETASALVFWAAFGFLGGVMGHAAYPVSETPISLLLTLGVVALGAGIILPWKMARAISILIVATGLGLWRFDLTIPKMEPNATFTGTVVEEGRYDVLIKDGETGMKISVSTRRRFGERVRVSCGSMQKVEGEKSMYDFRKGVWFKCKSPKISSLGWIGWNVKGLLNRWRTILTRRISAVLSGDAGGLLSGILYGERGLSPDASAAFKSAGMTHLIAVSGSNIALVVSLFVPIFLALGYRRKPAIVLSGVAIVLFVLFVGAGASVIRAAVMGWLALLARVAGRKASAGRLLVIAATAIVLFDPWALAFDAGFALSFLATWGLLSWSRPIQERLTFLPETAGLREGASTTLAATIVTAPYSLWAFGQTSLAGLLTNLAAIPLVGLTMLWGTVALVFGSIAPWIAMPAKGCLDAMLAIARLAEYAPWLQIPWQMPLWGLPIVYGYFLWTAFRRKASKNYPQEEIFEMRLWPSAIRAVSDR